MKDIEKLKEKILEELNMQGFNVFYGEVNNSTEKAIEVEWEEEDTWEDFLKIARNENIKTIIFEVNIFAESQIDSVLDEEENDIMAKKEKIEAFRKYIGKPYSITLYWIKDNILFSYDAFADWWYNEFRELLPSEGDEDVDEEEIKEQNISEELKRKTSEQLAKDLVDYTEKRGEIDVSETKSSFWELHGIAWDESASDPEIQIKIDEAELLASKELNAKVIKREKEIMPDLESQFVEWVKKEGYTKITKDIVDYFLQEKGIKLTHRSKDLFCIKAKASMLKRR